jgi:hypothetical protein
MLLACADASAREPILQRLAVIERHRDEELPAPFTDFVDGRDVRMVERARGLRLADEARLRHRVSRRAVRQELQGHIAVERLVARQIPDGRSRQPRSAG